MKTKQEIEDLGLQLYIAARDYELAAPQSFWNALPLEVGLAYNGTGPEWMPKWGRRVLDCFFDKFKAAVAVHDWRFKNSDRSKFGFNAANNEFYTNMKKIISELYPWYKVHLYPLRLRWALRARVAYRACQLGGWPAWMA